MNIQSFLRNRSAEIAALCGLLTMIAVSLQSLMIIRCAQMVFFMIFAALCGKRVRILPPAIMLISVIVANLFSPNGRVLFSVWRVDITYGALRLGLMKGSLLIALIYVSRVSVGPGLRIPGRFGALFLKTFAYFEELTERWPETRGNFIERIDALLEMMEIDDGGKGKIAEYDLNDTGPLKKTVKPKDARPYRRNIVIAIVITLAGWGSYIASVAVS